MIVSLGPSAFTFYCDVDLDGLYLFGQWKILGPIHMGSQVSSPNMEAKSRLLSLKKPMKYGWLSLKSNID